ncbi:NepR family anti-sigma factor [Halodurantibacterium flavum]|uniref:NepR family anti-sigma factor n=1 Tax=Halodurantibacterium flavum TaxID=1382802 RepID=A0ABW4S3M4_9RHOB
MPQHDRNIEAKARTATADQQPSAEARARSVAEQQINENLRRIYQEKLQEDVPDHLRVLLEKLKEQDRLK